MYRAGEGAAEKMCIRDRTETQGRVHTSTVTVAVMPEAEEVEIDINPADPVSYTHLDVYKRQGHGHALC